MKKSFLLLIAAALLGGCSNDNVTIEGEFAACPEECVVLESALANGAIVADSIRTNANG